MATSTLSVSSLKRISEDARLRPFLSPLFDPQAYIKTVIKDGKSEDCFNNIVHCIEDINVEIKGYISVHKDDLMSGMQDVATLADRYSSLSSTAQKLNRNIDRLKKEAMESYGLVSNRTAELECIHSTSITLHQLKQFVHAKHQLDNYLKNSDETDLRNLSNAAKTVSELEKLLTNAPLLEIKLVADCASQVKAVGKNIRLLAQDRLLASIQEKNQASIANSLQVFYNLESLPEIILLVVDSTVKRTVDGSKAALDIEAVHSLLSQAQQGDTGAGALGAGVAAASAMAPMSATKKPAGAAAATGGIGAGTVAQVRNAIREVAHVWTSLVHEMALQIHVLQRVVAKKEDPATHEKFTSVLQRLGAGNALSGAHSHHQKSHHHHPHHQQQQTTNSLLSRGLLLELFWHRLADALQEVANDKVRVFTAASTRAYPYIRRAAVEMLQDLRGWTETEKGAAGLRGMSLRDPLVDDFSSAGMDGAEDEDFDDESNRGNNGACGMFGSLLWSQADLLGSAVSSSYSSSSSRAGKRELTRSRESQRLEGEDENPHNSGAGDSSHSSNNTSSGKESKEHSLVQGLKPMRDKYLLGVLAKMSAPIAQMFPELEGYTAAVPSKRDIQALTNAMQTEFSTGLIEGDCGLVQLICREFSKTVRLMLTKIEGMVMHTADTRTLSTAAGGFARSHAQQHNANLLQLLVQFKELLQKIPGKVRAAGVDASASLLASSATASSGSGASSSVNGSSSNAASSAIASVREMERAVEDAVSWIEEVADKHIMQPVVTLLSGYVTSVVVGMHKEGIVGGVGASPAVTAGSASKTATPSTASTSTYTGKAPVNNPAAEATLECSGAVQSLAKNLPVLLKAHLLSLPKCEAVVRAAEEVHVRALHSYVTVAALLRPVTEASRLRTAKDLAALEALLSSLHPVAEPEACPVLREYRAFRRLLFQQESNPSSVDTTATPQRKPHGGSIPLSAPPDARELMKQPYVSHLRPSTLLGYLISCAPPQLPSPFDTAAFTSGSTSNFDITTYVDLLTDVHLSQQLLTQAQKEDAASVRNLYVSSAEGDWREIVNEAQSWILMQRALDTFFQRIHVADATQKQAMRLWYETILDVGSKTFSV